MKYILILLIVLHSLFLFADENRTGCLIADFTTINTPTQIGVKSTSLFKAELSENYFYFIPEEKESNTILSKLDCDSDCIIKLHSIYGDSIIITGSINRIENIIGEKKISRYLVEDLKEEKYIVTVKVINLKNNSIEHFFEKELFNTKDIETEVKIIAREINQFYKIETPVPHESEQIEIKSPFLILSGFSIMPAYLKTFGDYKNIAKEGYGISASLSASILRFEHLYLGLNINTILFPNTRGTIDSAYMFSPHLMAGYTFNIYKNIKLLSLAGFGYIFHYIDGGKNITGSDNADFYYNPSLIMGMETSWSFAKNFELIFRPSWGIFFEQNNSFCYMLLNLGIRKNF